MCRSSLERNPLCRVQNVTPPSAACIEAQSIALEERHHRVRRVRITLTRASSAPHAGPKREQTDLLIQPLALYRQRCLPAACVRRKQPPTVKHLLIINEPTLKWHPPQDQDGGHLCRRHQGQRRERLWTRGCWSVACRLLLPTRGMPRLRVWTPRACAHASCGARRGC